MGKDITALSKVPRCEFKAVKVRRQLVTIALMRNETFLGLRKEFFGSTYEMKNPKIAYAGTKILK